MFLAWDEGLRREVALKLIQGRHDRDPGRRERFVREAEITARLGIPGSSRSSAWAGPTTAARATPCGSSEGETLGTAIARLHEPSQVATRGERPLAFRGLLGRFVAACNAVATPTAGG